MTDLTPEKYDKLKIANALINKDYGSFWDKNPTARHLLQSSYDHLMGVWKAKPATTDPMEKLFDEFCISAGIDFRRDDQTKEGSQLDYYLPTYNLYVEVKQMHSPRIAEQMSRRHNVIAIQGMEAMRGFGKMIGATIETCNGR